MSRRRAEVMAFFQGLLEHAAVEGQLGDEELEPTDFIFEFRDANLLLGDGFLLEGLPTIVGGDSDASLTAGLADVQARVKVGLELTENLGDLVRFWRFSQGSLPGSLPVVRFPLRLDQLLGGRPMSPLLTCELPPCAE
jgi:hypothetical protein